MKVAKSKRLDVYGGREPGAIPVYTIAEAAHFLRHPYATVRAWTVGRTYETASGPRRASPVIEIADRSANLLSFNNLVELHVLSSMRRTHGLKFGAIRRSVAFLKRHFQSRHPLLQSEMLTDGKDLFVEKFGELVAISQHGQMAMKHVLELFLQRIDRDDAGAPIRLFPFTRVNVERSPRLVAIDPKIRFGKPCLSGTRIPTAIIAERYEAGDSIMLLAEDYGRTTEEIEEAIRYESRIAV